MSKTQPSTDSQRVRSPNLKIFAGYRQKFLGEDQNLTASWQTFKHPHLKSVSKAYRIVSKVYDQQLCKNTIKGGQYDTKDQGWNESKAEWAEVGEDDAFFSWHAWHTTSQSQEQYNSKNRT